MTGDVEHPMREGKNPNEAAAATSVGSGKEKEKGRHSKNHKKSSSHKSKREGRSGEEKEETRKKEAGRAREREKEKEGRIGSSKSSGKNGKSSSNSERKDRKEREESTEERGKRSDRERRDRTRDHKRRHRHGDSSRGDRDRKNRDESRVEKKRQERGRHSTHHGPSSRSRRSGREDSHRKREGSSERHRSRRGRHSRESENRRESSHNSSKRKRNSTTDTSKTERETKRHILAAAGVVATASAAAASPAFRDASPIQTEADIGGKAAAAASQQLTRAPITPPPSSSASEMIMKAPGVSQGQQQRGRAAPVASRGSPSPPRGGMRYKSRSNSRGRERRSPSYGAYRGRDISAEREEPKANLQEEGEGDGEDEDEVFDLSLTGGRFSELLDQEVSCSVAGGELPIPDAADTLDGCKDGDKPLLDPLVVENLKKMKCRWLLPIQRYAIPIVARGHDLLGCAATGCGKTLAFLAPLVSRVIGCGGLFRPHFPGSHAQASPLSVVLCPTRELAIQIDEQLERLMAGSNLSHSLWIGGVSATEQVHEINQRQIDVAVCTPGRVDELCLRGKVTLEFVQLLVLDEADAMLDLGFQKVMTELATSRDMPENRQTLLFSATFPPNLQSMLPSILRSPYFRVEVGKTLSRMRDETAISQEVKWVQGWNEKLAELIKDIEAFIESQPAGGDGKSPGEGGQVIVFVSGKRAVMGVAEHMRAANIGTETLFGTMQQELRKQVYLSFRSRKVRALVATSIAARGLDFPDVGLVINFEMPPTIEPYVHRIGRTGRAGRSGRAISYFTQKDIHLAGPLSAHLIKCKAPIPPWLCRYAK